MKISPPPPSPDVAFFDPPKLYAEEMAKSGFARHSWLRRTQSEEFEQRQEEIMYYIYSLKCKHGYYVGCTDDIADRLDRHKKGTVPATANRLPISLEFYFATEDKYKAFNFEKYLKSGSGRAFLKKKF